MQDNPPTISVITPTICGHRCAQYVCTRPQGHGPVKATDPDNGEVYLHVQESKGLPPVYWNFDTSDLNLSPVQDASENRDLANGIRTASSRLGLRLDLRDSDYLALAGDLRALGFTWNRRRS